jgi:hypothetical protein
VTRITTDQAPSAKPVSISVKVTNQWQTIIDAPDYDVPVVGFGTTRRIAPGVSEISSPLMVANIINASSNISVRIIKSERYIIDAQDETNYNNVSSNGTFSGGVGHAVSDTITLDNGATILVDAVSSGTVTQFTIQTVGSRVARDGNGESILTQAITSGTGEDFTLTARENNYDTTDGIFTLTNEYPVEFKDTMIIPLNGQFLLTGDRLQIKAPANDQLVATISFTEGQAEEDDIFTGA